MLGLSNARLISSCCIAAFALTILGCSDDAPEATVDTTGTSSASSETADAVPASDQVEKQKPAPGTGNVQGKVMYNGKPVEGIEVTLCEEFSRFGTGCGGNMLKAKTDAAGEYVITNVPPKEYAALIAQVFDTESYVFATQGYGISSATYKVEADKTLFAQPTNLFKSDLKVASPKAGSKVAGEGMAISWDPYPDAAYYKFSLFADSIGVTSPYISYRVDSSAFAVTKPLEKGGYRLEVEAYNESDIKLATNSDDLKFDVQ